MAAPNKPNNDGSPITGVAQPPPAKPVFHTRPVLLPADPEAALFLALERSFGTAMPAVQMQAGDHPLTDLPEAAVSKPAQASPASYKTRPCQDEVAPNATATATAASAASAATAAATTAAPAAAPAAGSGPRVSDLLVFRIMIIIFWLFTTTLRLIGIILLRILGFTLIGRTIRRVAGKLLETITTLALLSLLYYCVKQLACPWIYAANIHFNDERFSIYQDLTLLLCPDVGKDMYSVVAAYLRLAQRAWKLWLEVLSKLM